MGRISFNNIGFLIMYLKDKCIKTNQKLPKTDIRSRCW